VTELSKLLTNLEDALVTVEASAAFFTLSCDHATISVKLIDEKYPIYQGIFPKVVTETVTVNTQQFKQAIGRVAILASDRFGRVELNFSEHQLSVTSNSEEQEEAEDVIDIELTGEAFSIAFKCSYLIELINNIESENMQLLFPENKSTVLVKDLDDDQVSYILSPIRT